MYSFSLNANITKLAFLSSELVIFFVVVADDEKYSENKFTLT